MDWNDIFALNFLPLAGFDKDMKLCEITLITILNNPGKFMAAILFSSAGKQNKNKQHNKQITTTTEECASNFVLLVCVWPVSQFDCYAQSPKLNVLLTASQALSHDQHQRWTSLMLLWIGANPCSQVTISGGKSETKDWRSINCRSVGMTCSAITHCYSVWVSTYFIRMSKYFWPYSEAQLTNCYKGHAIFYLVCVLAMCLIGHIVSNQINQITLDCALIRFARRFYIAFFFWWSPPWLGWHYANSLVSLKGAIIFYNLMSVMAGWLWHLHRERWNRWDRSCMFTHSEIFLGSRLEEAADEHRGACLSFSFHRSQWSLQI